MNKLGKVAVALAMVFSVGAAGAAEPAHYLTYLQGNNGQYINTGCKPTKDARVEMEVEFTAVTQNETLFCTRGKTTSENTFTLFSLYDSSAKKCYWRFDYGNAAGKNSAQTIATATRYVIVASKAGVYVNDEKVCEGGDEDFEPADCLTVFSSHYNGQTSNLGNYGKYKLYSFKVYDTVDEVENTLVCDLIPAITVDGVGGEICLYDKENDAVCGKKGSGFFIAGPTTDTAETYCQLTVSAAANGSIVPVTGAYPAGTVVNLSATPNAGYAFYLWSGSNTKVANPNAAATTVTMSDSYSLTANFKKDGERVHLFVKPTATGTKDGSSWENACTLDTAYTKASTCIQGGEIWMVKGRYNKNSAYTMSPNIIIRGGFAGTETSADEADPKANSTIIAHSSYNSGTDTWGYGADKTMWTGEDLMTLVEPTCGDNTAVFGYGYDGGGSLFNNTDGADLGETGFYGVWFHRYNTHVLQTTSANAKPIVFKNCRFTACGFYMHNTDKTINASNASVDIEDCEFIGCANTVYLTTSSKDSPVTTNVVKGCRFYTCDWNWNCSPVASGVAACNNAKLILRDSVFDKCRNSSNGGDTRSGAVLLYGMQDALIENCVFRRSMTTTGSRAAAVTITPQTNTFVATFNRCRFENNTYSGSGRDAHNSVGAAIGATGTGRLYVNDSLFVGNVVTNSTYGNPAATCVGLTGSWNGAFANCTFEDNVAIDTAGRTLRYTFTTSWTASRYFAFANCVFNNNICGYSNTDVPFKRQVEFRKPDAANEPQTYSFVNCVFANEAEDYKMFVEGESMSWGDDLAFANCVTSSTNSWGKATKNTFRYEPLDNATLAPLKDYTETNGVTVARGIAETSVYRKKGRPVYRAANGDLYIYDTVFNAAKPWRLLRSPGTVYTPEEGAAKGLSPRGEPIADAFGEPRSKIKGALGPIDWKLPGMMLLVR